MNGPAIFPFFLQDKNKKPKAAKKDMVIILCDYDF